MRTAKINRDTLETSIELTLTLDGSGKAKIQSGIGFFDHMLKALAFYANFDLELNCRGDLEVDSHHSMEDIGLCFGAALREALGDKSGIQRFASTITPMDESLVLVALDLSNRPILVDNLCFKSERLGIMETENIKEFLRAFANSAGITLHIDFMRGENDHHKTEALFKGLGLALKAACSLGGNTNAVASTKGVL